MCFGLGKNKSLKFIDAGIYMYLCIKNKAVIANLLKLGLNAYVCHQPVQPEI